MKKIDLCAILRKEACSRLTKFMRSAYTLAEVIIVMLIIAVIVAVSIGITKAKLDNVISYTYYNAYSTLREITTDMLANWDPKNPEYKQAISSEKQIKLAQIDFSNGLQNPILKFKDKLLSSYRDIWSQPAYARCAPWAVGHGQTCVGSGGRLCNPAIHQESGCYACCTPKSPSSGGPELGFDKPLCLNPDGTSSPAFLCPDGSTVCPSLGQTCGGSSCKIFACLNGLVLDKESCSCKYKCPNGSLVSSASSCPKVTCWDGSKADTSSDCPPKVACWDGSYATSSSKCPDKIACCDGTYKTDASKCPLQQSCWDGSTVCGGSCPQKITCWDGSFATSSSKCPSYVTCWNGEKKHNSSECPKADCWNGTQANTPSDCPPKITCWDGSFATSSSNCPSYVTCWDGSKKYNWSECPACTNKPNPLPCGQGWDEHTCTLTGTPKTCPGGQHLNSGCECVLDCPSNLTPCQLCSNETGVVSKNPDINRTCSDETYEWSEEQCKCIISPRTLPRQGANFCKLFEANANIMGNTDVCQGSAIASNTTDFSDKKPDVTLRNGLRIYNMHNDATAIAMLAGNTQGGVYDGVPNTNAYGYTVYIDIDGVKGDSKLWSDVYPFYITLSGKVIPGYDATANPNGAGGDSTSHMQVSVEYENYNSGKRAITWLAKSVPFKEGACLSGYVGDATPYCRNNPAVTKAPNCTTDSDSVCRVKQIKPVKFFF